MRFSLFLLLCFLQKISFSQCDLSSQLSGHDSIVKDHILKLKKEEYKGMSVGKFIEKKYIKEYCKRSYIQYIVGVLGGVELRYKGFIMVRILISRKETEKFTGKAATWDFDKIKKCTIYRIEIVDNSDSE